MTTAPRGLIVAAIVLTAAAGGAGVYRFVTSRSAANLYAANVPATVANQNADDQPGSGGPGDDSASAGSPGHSAIPDHLPDFALPGADGEPHKLSEWKGRALIVNFWATWCAPCRREIPLLESLREKRSAQGLEIVGIAVDFHEAVIKYAHEMRIHYPLLIGERGGLEAASAFGMDPVFPFSVFADRQGRIVALKVGELHPAEAELILDRLADVDGGRLGLGQARLQISDGLAHLAAERARAEPSGM